MANLPEVSQWENVYQIEVTDPVQGGVNGTTNVPLKNLTNRTKYLYDTLASAVAGLSSTSASVTNHEGRITANEADILALKGAVSGYKHCVITALSNNASPAFVETTYNGGTGNTTLKLKASTTLPFIASVTCGYDNKGLSNKYVYISSDVTATIGGINPNGFIIFVKPDGTLNYDGFVSYAVAYTAPSSPATNALWYNMTAERMFKWNGSIWVAFDCLVLGVMTFLGNPGNPSGVAFTYAPTIGKSIINLYGRTTVPAGTVHTFAGTVANIPTGYLLANGGAISRTAYADLFSAIGTTYGAGDGSTTFSLPDLRGEFLRGLDNGRGIDPNSISKVGSITNGSTIIGLPTTSDLAVGMTVTGTGIPAGATVASIVNSNQITISAAATTTTGAASLTFAGRMLGTAQSDMFKSHSHVQRYTQGGGPDEGYAIDSSNDPSNQVTTSITTASTGGTETRPRNIAMNFIVKF